MNIENLVVVLMAVYFTCAYFVTHKFTMLVFQAGNGRYYEFKARWYHKAAGTYVLALPIFIFLTYLIGKVGA